MIYERKINKIHFIQTNLKLKLKTVESLPRLSRIFNIEKHFKDESLFKIVNIGTVAIYKFKRYHIHLYYYICSAIHNGQIDKSIIVSINVAKVIRQT